MCHPLTAAVLRQKSSYGLTSTRLALHVLSSPAGQAVAVNSGADLYGVEVGVWFTGWWLVTLAALGGHDRSVCDRR
jgi:hypothetical protein